MSQNVEGEISDERSDDSDVIEGSSIVGEGRYVLEAEEPSIGWILDDVKDPSRREALDEPALRFDGERTVESGERSRFDDGVQDTDDFRGIVRARVTYSRLHRFRPRSRG